MSSDKDYPPGRTELKVLKGKKYIEGCQFESPKYRVWINTRKHCPPSGGSVSGWVKGRGISFLQPWANQPVFGCNIGEFDKPEDGVRAAHWQMERATNLWHYFPHRGESKDEGRTAVYVLMMDLYWHGETTYVQIAYLSRDNTHLKWKEEGIKLVIVDSKCKDRDTGWEASTGLLKRFKDLKEEFASNTCWQVSHISAIK